MATPREFPHLDGVEQRFVKLPGLRMHIAEAGSGEHLLLLHGFPQHWWEWHKVLPALSQRYRVICPDLWGPAGPTHPAPATPPSSWSRTWSRCSMCSRLAARG